MSLMTPVSERNPQLIQLDLRPSGPNGSVLFTPGGQIYEIDEPLEQLTRFLKGCDGLHSREELLGKTERPSDYAALLDLLVEEGCLRDHPQAKQQAVSHLLITGDQSLSESLAMLLEPQIKPRYTPLENLAEDLKRSEKPIDLVVVLLKYVDERALSAVNQLCKQATQPWFSMHFEGKACVMGPWIIPGQSSDYEDVLGRRRCSGNHIEKAQLKRPLLVEEGAPCSPRMPSADEQSVYLAKFAHYLNVSLASGEPWLLSTEQRSCLTSGSETLHTVLPLPTRVPGTWRAHQRSAWDMLVDSRVGIVLSQKRVPHHPTIPSSLITIRTHCTDLAQIYDWGNDLFVGGSSFDVAPPAHGASLGEGLERYCGNCLPGVDTIHGSYDSLKEKGYQVLDPEQVILHSKQMLATPGCPFVPFTRNLAVHWVEGRSLTNNQPSLLPLSMVYANWCSGEFSNEPVTHYLYTPGMAAGVNLERALVGALRELVERDITMIWWLNAHRLPAVKPTKELQDLWLNTQDAKHQKVKYIHLDNPFNIPVMAAVVENTRHNFLNIGFGCRANPVEAAKKALSEALTLQEGSRDLLEKDSMLRKSVDEWGLLSVPYKPWREDRAYMDSFKPDYRDINDLMLQQQFYLDPRAVTHIRPLWDTPETRSFDQLPVLKDDTLATYAAAIESQGFEILYADITSPDVDLTGYKVVRALVPGLVPNMPAAFPAVGGARVTQAPVEMGWRKTPLTEKELNMFPMPHA